MVAGLDAVPLCTTPTPPPSSAAWPLGAAAQAAALHSKPRGVAQATPHRGVEAAAVVDILHVLILCAGMSVPGVSVGVDD